MENISKRINALNGLKGLFILFIVIFHTLSEETMLGKILYPVKLYGGYMGNYMFFMLSGFLTAYSFSQKRIADRDFLSYIGKKLIKFWPLFALTNIWQLGYKIITEGIGAFSISTLLLVLTMQTGGGITNMSPYNYPGWFLCTLMVCYVVHYLVRYLCKDDSKKYVWCFYALIIWGLILILKNPGIPFCYECDGEGFACFFFGCILFEHYELIRKGKPVLYPLWIAGTACLFCLPLNPVIGDVRLLVILIFCPVLILLLMETSFLSKIFLCRPAQFMGKISMCIFLLHAINPLCDIPSMIPRHTVGYAVYLSALIGISSLVTYLINAISKRSL